jgi:hypothetical protein
VDCRPLTFYLLGELLPILIWAEAEFLVSLWLCHSYGRVASIPHLFRDVFRIINQRKSSPAFLWGASSLKYQN